MQAHWLTISIQVLRQLTAHEVEEGGLVNQMIALPVVLHVWTHLVQQAPLHQAAKALLSAILPTFAFMTGIVTG